MSTFHLQSQRYYGLCQTKLIATTGRQLLTPPRHSSGNFANSDSCPDYAVVMAYFRPSSQHSITENKDIVFVTMSVQVETEEEFKVISTLNEFICQRTLPQEFLVKKLLGIHLSLCFTLFGPTANTHVKFILLEKVSLWTPTNVQILRLMNNQLFINQVK